MNRIAIARRGFVQTAVTLAIAACSGGGGGGATGPSGPPASLALTGSAATTARAGLAVVDSPSVLVKNASGVPLPGVSVTFTVLTGGGTVYASPVVTNASGIARARWTVGGALGTQTLRASVDTLTPIVFSATVTAGPIATITILAGNGQNAAPSTVLPIPLTVKAVDAFANPVSGDTIVFTPTTGASDLLSATQITDANGTATLGSWTVPRCAGTTQVTAARVGNGTATAVASATVTGSIGFCVELLYTTNPDPIVKAAAERAAVRWGKIVTATFAPETLNYDPANPPPGPTTCAGITIPQLRRIIRSVLIIVDLSPIPPPGPGLVTLGRAGPCFIRNVGTTTVFGGLRLNGAYLLDRANISDTVMTDVVLHEMGHVLGYGTLWSNAGLIQDAIPSTQPVGTPSVTLPSFSGALAIAAYQAIGGPSGNIPVEGCGSSGTVNGHWRESVFGTELMTGYVNGALGNVHNPLSAVTIKSIADLGYAVDVTQADPYVRNTRTCPSGSGYNPGSLIGAADIVQERLAYPTHRLRGGTLIPIVRR